MTNKELKQAKKGLYVIEQKKSYGDEQYDLLKKWVKYYGVHTSSPPETTKFQSNVNWIDEALENAHRFLQTEMMLNTCFSAKWSCIWAAMAASIALFATIAAWITVFLTLKGI